MGFEALSRGAVHATFLDKNSEVLKYVHQSSTQMNVQDKCVTRRSDATSLPPGSIPHTIAFVDPPYSQDITPAILTELHTKNWLAPKALVVTEIKAKQAFIPPSTYHILDERTYGAAQIYLLLYQPH